jgi:hypothetical protein
MYRFTVTIDTRLDDFFRLHRPRHNHLAGEHPEAPDVRLLVLKHWQMSVDITNLAVFGFYCHTLVDLGYSRWKDGQL